MFLLWHPWLTTTNLSYSFRRLETSATALCGTTGMYICTIVRAYIYIYNKYDCRSSRCTWASHPTRHERKITVSTHWTWLQTWKSKGFRHYIDTFRKDGSFLPNLEIVVTCCDPGSQRGFLSLRRCRGGDHQLIGTILNHVTIEMGNCLNAILEVLLHHSTSHSASVFQRIGTDLQQNRSLGVWGWWFL